MSSYLVKMQFATTRHARNYSINMGLLIFLPRIGLKLILEKASLLTEFHLNSGWDRRTKNIGMHYPFSSNRIGAKRYTLDVAKLLA